VLKGIRDLLAIFQDTVKKRKEAIFQEIRRHGG
jgi:hypothetical protein